MLAKGNGVFPGAHTAVQSLKSTTDPPWPQSRSELSWVSYRDFWHGISTTGQGNNQLPLELKVEVCLQLSLFHSHPLVDLVLSLLVVERIF